jgi:hypothetical protein
MQRFPPAACPIRRQPGVATTMGAGREGPPPRLLPSGSGVTVAPCRSPGHRSTSYLTGSLYAVNDTIYLKKQRPHFLLFYASAYRL